MGGIILLLYIFVRFRTGRGKEIDFQTVEWNASPASSFGMRPVLMSTCTSGDVYLSSMSYVHYVLFSYVSKSYSEVMKDLSLIVTCVAGAQPSS
jgi:hypothetical protein